MKLIMCAACLLLVIDASNAFASEELKQPGFVEPVLGSVTAYEADAKLVTLNVGSAQGIVIEDRLAIWRENDFCSGWLVVTSVDENVSKATVAVGSSVAVEDKVLKDTTMLLSELLVRAGDELDPFALARRYASSDLGNGVRRVLFYGKCVVATGTRKDEASKLPMQINGGCVVSKQFLDFTKEYNRIMREAALKRLGV